MESKLNLLFCMILLSLAWGKVEVNHILQVQFYSLISIRIIFLFVAVYGTSIFSPRHEIPRTGRTEKDRKPN
jgi:hypothetical protein